MEENLQQGQIRLIIATDELRPEVRRIIEYLNGEMKRAKVYGLELRCYGEGSGSLVLVPNLIGQPPKEPPEVTLWTVERLQAAYNNLANTGLGKRLREVLDCAVGQGFFLEAKAKNPTFGLRGRSSERIERIASSFSDGIVYCYLNEKYYPGGVDERDRFVAELKAHGMLDAYLDPMDVVSGRNLTRKLTDLSEDEFRKPLEVFSRYCGRPGGKESGYIA